jgi:pyridoxamine 5'-phosphate oxidase
VDENHSTDLGFLASVRRDYVRGELREEDLSPDPLPELDRWVARAVRLFGLEGNSMVLATARADGTPSARVVLLKGRDERGLHFFTDTSSRKGADLAANPRAAVVFYWAAIDRQLRVRGTVAPLPADEAAAYFATRPAGSQLAATSSHQSAVLADRAELERRVEEVRAAAGEEAVAMPERWGGYVLLPDEVEFWQGRENRLHDRILYTRDGDAWRKERLSP